MTFDAACKVPNPYGITHDEKMDCWIRHIGRDNIKKHLPARIPTIAKAYLDDQNLNTIPLKKWEAAAGFADYQDRQSAAPPKGKGPFIRLIASKGVTEFSMSECVCLLKRCAELEALDYLKCILAKQQPPAEQLQFWAVFEHQFADPDPMNKYNIFDFDCVRTFPEESVAIAFEQDNPGRRVRKLITVTYP